MVQIDGLGLNDFTDALDKNELPFLSKLIKNEHYYINPLYSGLPSSTPAVQGELFYGVKTAVPAFAFIDGLSQAVFRMYDPQSALEVEQRLKKQGEPLLKGGSAYCNIYTGGATESHFCAASSGWGDLVKQARPIAWIGVSILFFPVIVRTCLRIGLEFVLGLVDLLRGWIGGFNVKAELKFVISRVAISVLLRDLITIGACVDISRDRPIIHLNYLGYDEQAHRRGPHSAFAHWTLKGIDRCIAKLWTACHLSSGRHYDIWIYSDHGQEATTSYQALTGTSLVDAVGAAIGTLTPGPEPHLLALNERIAQSRTNLLGSTYLKRLFPSQNHKSSDAALPGSSVIAMGPVGHVYLDNDILDIISLEAIASELVSNAALPAVAFKQNTSVLCQCRSGLITLPGDGEALFGDSHPALEPAVEDLMALVCHPDAGQLVILGWAAGCKPITFPTENGAHAGIGPRETMAFALLPGEQCAPSIHNSILRPLDLRGKALALLDRAPQTEANLPVPRIYQPRQRSRGMLRVMSYNVHSCVGMDSRVAPERIARVISQARPDIVALQELDVSKNRTGSVDQANVIADLLNMHCHFHPTIQSAEEKYGDAIITRLPIISARMSALPTPLSLPGSEPRGVVWLTLELDGMPIQVLNTHLGLYAKERVQQLGILASADWLRHSKCTGPTILCGDMNTSVDSVAMRLISGEMNEVQSMLGQLPRNKTFSGRFPHACLDHIWVRDIEHVIAVKVPNTELTRLASDHLPLIADMKLF